jgi:hypothetical protein
MAISRAAVLKELLPGLQALFGTERIVHVIKTRNGKCSIKEETYMAGIKTESKLVAKDLTRNEAIALRKLITGEE